MNASVGPVRAHPSDTCPAKRETASFETRHANLVVQPSLPCKHRLRLHPRLRPRLHITLFPPRLSRLHQMWTRPFSTSLRSYAVSSRSGWRRVPTRGWPTLPPATLCDRATCAASCAPPSGSVASSNGSRSSPPSTAPVSGQATGWSASDGCRSPTTLPTPRRWSQAAEAVMSAEAP